MYAAGECTDDFMRNIELFQICNFLGGELHVHTPDCGLDPVRIHIPGLRVDIDEYRTAAVPPDGVGRGDETVGRRDDLAGNPERLQGR